MMPEDPFFKRVRDAIEIEDLEALKGCLSERPDLFRTTVWDRADGTWIHAAVAHHKVNKEMLRFILDHGGKEVIDVRNDGDYTPFFIAKCWGHDDLTPLFAEYGADTSIRALNGNTELHFAILNHNLKKAEKLARSKSPPDYHAINDERTTPFDSLTGYICAFHRDYDYKPWLAFLLSHRAHYCPGKGTWRPSRHPEQYSYEAIGMNKAFPVLFAPDYWTGIESEALALRDRMLQVIKDEKLLSELRNIDFSSFERKAATVRNRAGEGKFATFLRKRTTSPSTPGGGL